MLFKELRCAGLAVILLLLPKSASVFRQTREGALLKRRVIYGGGCLDYVIPDGFSFSADSEGPQRRLPALSGLCLLMSVGDVMLVLATFQEGKHGGHGWAASALLPFCVFRGIGWLCALSCVISSSLQVACNKTNK